jgi:FMN-dependent NADH-azoreductase
MLIEPIDDFEISTASEIEGDITSSILQEAGVSQPSFIPASTSKDISPVSKILDAAEASMQEVAVTVSDVMRNSEKDSDRLKAAEMTARLHGALKDADKGVYVSPVINLQVVSSFSEKSKSSNQMMRILVPSES